MRRFAVSALVAMIGLCAISASASAEVSPAEAEQAAAKGASWFQQTQNENGALAAALGGGNRFGEWSLTALAAGGVNAADSRVSLLSDTAQQYYDGYWSIRGPGAIACPVGEDNPAVCDQQPDGLPTDSARTVLSAIAGGLQPSRISADRDFVSRLAFWWSGDQIGYRDLLNDDIFAILALWHSGAPQELLETLALKVRKQQLPDGGWHWRATDDDSPLPANAASDTDMTASAIGALCAAGATPAGDEQIQEGLALIASRQSDALGGFSTSSSPTNTNTNSTAWVASAMNLCGIDPQNERWTTDSGKTPLDFLVQMQNSNGSFKYMPSNPNGSANLMASYQAVSPLGGFDWTGEAPGRENSGDPVVKPAPQVESGTVVPLTLILDHGEATPVEDRGRMCRVEVPEGSDLADVLEIAETKSAPGNCVEGVSTTEAGGEVTIDSVNGGEGSWTVEVDGVDHGDSFAGDIGLGDMVVLRYAGADKLTPPAVKPVEQIDGPVDPGPGPGPGPVDPGPGPGDGPDPIPSYARAKVVGKPSLRGGKVRAKIACPATATNGCAVMATFAVRQPARKRFAAFGATAAELSAGKSRVVAVKANKKLRKALKRTARKGKKGKALIRVTVGTRSADGVIRYARGRGMVRGL